MNKQFERVKVLLERIIGVDLEKKTISVWRIASLV